MIEQLSASQARAAEPAAAGATLADMTAGAVRKVDMDAGKLTLKHGEIRNLDMPPMTMVFRSRTARCSTG